MVKCGGKGGDFVDAIGGKAGDDMGVTDCRGDNMWEA